MNRWKSIWEVKNIKKLNLNKSEFEIFCDLKRADGFDVSIANEEVYYMSFYSAWKEMYQKLVSFDKGDINSIYEVGCGSGVNLFLFRNRMGEKVKLGGIDYSASLIDIAKRVIRCNDLQCDEAVNIDVTETYDLVISDSVFQYFDGLDYAEEVLRKMLLKANKLIYIGELHDISLKEQWLDYRRKSMQNYDEIYEGLPKMFYSRDWINSIAKEYKKKTYFTTLKNKEYWNSQYLFNCYIY